ncbi:TIM-barrel domain-containing protein [Dyella ginsengisoli]|uniref:glycoside hydrolase family 31 protein n=1 Tax=Dyella ginsengisoli TaxID=363848 RepID=UPI0004761AC4
MSVLTRRSHRTLAPLALFGLMLTPLASAIAATAAPATVDHGQLRIPLGADRVTVDFVAPDVVHVHYLPGGKGGPATLVLDPKAPNTPLADVRVQNDKDAITLSTDAASVRYDRSSGALRLDAPGHAGLLTQADLASLRNGAITLAHDASDPLYGIGGYTAFQKDVSTGLLRQGKQKITAGEQGHAGAPLVWSSAGYAVLVDTIGGQFNLAHGRIQASGSSRKDTDYYLIVGAPKTIFRAVADLSGHSQLFPKWAMGFTNSQWGIDQKELLSIVDTYRAKHIPIDNFTLDFDWKAWGEDWGEFRWNTTKFPDGPDGKLKQMLDARGMHLTGIMKPRVHVDTVEGHYATAHDFWSPASKEGPDYFSKKPIRELDFDKPAVRDWFFNDHLKHSFDTGMIGWWNDEADDIGSDTQFTNMERSLYDGQRAYSPLRVWSINRNFYLGAQRYAYGMWSGDIPTGFHSMAGQRARMLSAINVGEMQWGMDGGGFSHGTPTPENYARWIEFGAFTPIFRVHGEFGQKRQPWVYGPVAEKAATAAIRLRYSLIPYIYSYEHTRHVTGVGLVRPLVFDWPNDPKVRNDVASWMFGEGLLVSPVVDEGQTAKTIYLPAGQWTGWFDGKTYAGGRSITVPVDAKGWSDIPLFVRAGAIIPMQPVMDYVGQRPVPEVAVEAFPASAATHFTYYDDQGDDYAYERGDYFAQPLAIQRTGNGATVSTSAAEGSYVPPVKTYLFKVHGGAASAVTAGGRALPHAASLEALEAGPQEGWTTGTDRFGAVTYIRVPAAQARQFVLVWGNTPG